MAAVTHERDDVPEVIRMLKRIAGVSDRMIGDALGLKLGSARNRVAGDVPWSYREVREIADYFEVPVELLYADLKTATDLAINRYEVPNTGWKRRSEQALRHSGCMDEVAA